ncbi:Uncharacterised protein [Legionella jordanis]|nr:Uncharacterised protein [Legionella jordanis]
MPISKIPCPFSQSIGLMIGLSLQGIERELLHLK